MVYHPASGRNKRIRQTHINHEIDGLIPIGDPITRSADCTSEYDTEKACSAVQTKKKGG